LGKKTGPKFVHPAGNNRNNPSKAAVNTENIFLDTNLGGIISL